MRLLYVSEQSKHFLKPVKKLGWGWRPTPPLGQIPKFDLFFKASLTKLIGISYVAQLAGPSNLLLKVKKCDI